MAETEDLFRGMPASDGFGVLSGDPHVYNIAR